MGNERLTESGISTSGSRTHGTRCRRRAGVQGRSVRLDHCCCGANVMGYTTESREPQDSMCMDRFKARPASRDDLSALRHVEWPS